MEPCNFSLFSLNEKSEQDLPTSERENGWWVAYGSMPSSRVSPHNRKLLDPLYLTDFQTNWSDFFTVW